MQTILWGGTGQAKVVRPILESNGHSICAVFDNGAITSPFHDVPLIGGEDTFDANCFRGLGFVVAIGGQRGETRAELSERLEKAGLRALSAVHDKAFVAASATLGKGVQIMAIAAICEESEIGDFTIINTKASVDHECRLGRGVHVMPGAVLAGCVEVDDYATIGSGAVVLPRIHVGSGAMIGAGAVVTKNVAPGTIVIGCPARLR